MAHAIVDADVFARVGAWRWTLSGGYPVTCQNGQRMRLHRVVMGDPPTAGVVVDHVSAVKLDNRRSNLRWVTPGQNNQNVRSRRDNVSGYRGVSFDSRDKRWRGEVRVGGRKVWRRYFSNQRDAALATAAARRELLPYATA